MAALDVTSANNVLKELYDNQRVEMLTYKDMPFYAMLKKVKNFEGKVYPLPMRVANPAGSSATFANAQAQKLPSVYDTFYLTRKSYYALASISTEAILASSTDAGAFLKLAAAEIDGALENLKRTLGWALYGDGSGSLGAVASVSSTNPEVITLAVTSDIVRFEINQTIQARSGATTRIFATGVTQAVVTNVNRSAGTITLGAVDNSGNTDTIVPGDTLNVVGNYNAMLSGLEAWIPAVAPTSTLFFGVDRTVDTDRLAGVRLDGTGMAIDEALISLARAIANNGGNPDVILMNYSKYADLEKTLGSKIRYGDMTMGRITFKAIELPGPQGTIKVLSDRDCPQNRVYMLQSENWAFYSLKEPIMVVDLDGTKMLRESSADAFEVRCASYSQLGCDAPRGSGVLFFT